MTSPQTLSEDDRRTLARWAAACAAHVLPLFAAEGPSDALIRDAVARAAVFARGEGTAAEEIRLRMVAVTAAGDATTSAGAAAARSAAQAAAAYAVKAASLAEGDDAARAELAWQLGELTDEERAALRRLPALGADSAGPLGPGLLSRGILGDTIRAIQAAVGT